MGIALAAGLFGGDPVIHWAWTLIAFSAGVVVGMFWLAFAEVSRQEDEKKRKWWDE